MGLEKSTYVTTQTNGRLEFKSGDGNLKIEFIDANGILADAATIGEDDLRSLLRDFFPGKCGPRKTGKAANGAAGKKSKHEAATA